jgi:voltage-gated potassium channel
VQSKASPALRRGLELAVIAAALATIPLTLGEELGLPRGLVVVGNWIAWAIFAGEYATMTALSARPWKYALRHWLHLLVIAFSFPLLPDLLGLTRLVRLARVVAAGALSLREIRQVLGRPGLFYLSLLTGTLVLVGAVAVVLIEPRTVHGSLGNGVWWAFITATTVGYGDIAPVTPAGRTVAALLVLTGIGLMSTVSASIAAYFVEQDERSEKAEILARLAEVRQEVAEIRRLLERRQEPDQVAEPED